MRRSVRVIFTVLALAGIAAGAGAFLTGAWSLGVFSMASFLAAAVLEESERPSRSSQLRLQALMDAARAGSVKPALTHAVQSSHDVASKQECTVSPLPGGSQSTTEVAPPIGLPSPTAGSSASPPTAAVVRAPVSVEPEDVIEAFRTAASAAGEVLSAHLWLEDESSATVRLVACAGVMRPSMDPQPIASTCLGRALSTGRSVVSAESIHKTAAADRTVWRYAVPLSSGEARGVAAVDVAAESLHREALTRASADLRTALTGALAIHTAREQTRLSNTLLTATRELSRLVDVEAVVNTLVEWAVRLSSAQTCSVMLVDEHGRLSIAASLGLPAEVPAITSISEGEGIAGWVLSTRQSVVVEDLEWKGPRSRRHGVRSAISVPIVDDDGILGVLNVGNRNFKPRFTATMREALETLGRAGALAIRTARALETSQDLYFDTLKALAIALETKDPYARGATERIVELVCDLAAELSMSESETTAVRIAALLHDVGMSAAGDVVAVSDRPLSTVEWGMVKIHPVIAADVLEQAPALRVAIPIVYHHHERFDGQGYVVGLAAKAIPLGARVLAVADSYVAMTSDRPYRAAMTEDEALVEIRSNAGTQFDPEVVDALERLLGKTSSHMQNP